MLYSSEASERRTLNHKLAKQLTGDKTFQLRAMRGNGFNTPVSWVIWCAMNKRPRLAGIDDSLRSRLVLIRWPDKDWRAAENRDVDLPDRIERELRGEILRWALGYRDSYETILRRLTPRIRNDTKPVHRWRGRDHLNHAGGCGVWGRLGFILVSQLASTLSRLFNRTKSLSKG